MTTTAYSRALHLFARFLVFCTFILLLAGGSVTSNDAGLAVPDWPTSFGSVYKVPPMVGGVLYEHGHRMIAQFVGFLTIVLAVWLQRTDKRAWMRKLGWAALGLVIVQGIFGGIGVLLYLPPVISSLHGTLAQTFFSLTVLITLFTSRTLLEGNAEQRVEPTGATIPLRTLSLLLVGSIYIQLMTGAAFRHVWTKLGPNGKAILPSGDIVWTYLAPHLMNLAIVVSLIVWTAGVVLWKFGSVPALRRPAMLLLGLLQAQLALGFLSYLTRVEWSAGAVQPTTSLVLATVGHLGVGAAILATAFVLAAQVRRHVVAPESVLAEATERKAVTA